MNRVVGHSTLVIIISTLVYINGLSGDFIFDDRLAIVDNLDVNPGKNHWFELFTHDFWGQDISRLDSHKSYRPITILSFRWNKWFTGMNPLHFHIVNLVLHVLASLLMYYISLGPPRVGHEYAFVGSLIFAVHPIHTEAVTGIVGRAELLCAVFFQLCFLTYRWAATLMEAKQRVSLPSVMALLLAGICFWIATLSKETGLTSIGVCFLFDLVHSTVGKLLELRNVWSKVERSRNTSVWKTVFPFCFRQLFLVCNGAAYVFLRRHVTVHFTLHNFRHVENPFAFLSDTLSRILSKGYIHAKYFQLLLYPLYMCPDYSFNQIPSIASLWDVRNLWTVTVYMSLIIIGLVSGLSWWRAIYARHHNTNSSTITCSGGATLMALAWLVIPFLPASQVFYHVGTNIGERLLYIPSIGFCQLLALAGSAYLCRSERLGRVTAQRTKLLLWSFMLLLVAVYTSRTLERNMDWQSEETLFSNAFQVCGDSAKVQLNVGILLRRTRQWDEAMKCFRKALDIEPGLCDVYYWIGLTLWDLGKFHDATTVLFSQSLGCVYNQRLAADALRTMYTAMIHAHPTNATLYNQLGHVLVSLDDLPRAIAAYERSLQLDPTIMDTYHDLALIYAHLGNGTRALELLQVPFMRNPENNRTTELLINILTTMWANNPSDHTIPNALGSVFHTIGKHEKAADLFRKSIELSPSYVTAWANLVVVEWFIGTNIPQLLADLETLLALDPANELGLKLKQLLLEKVF